MILACAPCMHEVVTLGVQARLAHTCPYNSSLPCAVCSHKPSFPSGKHGSTETRPCKQRTRRQDGVERVGAKVAQVGDGERAAVELIRRQLLRPRALHLHSDWPLTHGGAHSCGGRLVASASSTLAVQAIPWHLNYSVSAH